MPVTASQLRADVYRLLDKTLKTGKPLEVIRNGKILRIEPEKKRSKLAGLTKRKCYKGAAEDYIHLDWSKEWRP